MDGETCPNEMTTDTLKTVNVMLALNAALAVAVAHSGTVDGVQLRLWNQQKRTAVIDAIRYELIGRNNRRIARGLPPIGKIGLSARLERPWLAKSIEHARAHEQKMIEWAGAA